MSDARRPDVKKLDKPVIRDGHRLWWRYRVPLQYGGELGGWRETQREAYCACLALLSERKSKGWT